jgi:hypothetical protein
MVRDVLVFTPILRIEPETLDAIFSLEWDEKISYLLQRDNPIPEQRDKLKRSVMNHLHQFQRGREMFLAGRYDAMLVIESDIIPPADTLQKLAALDADCAYGVYRFRASNVINIYERYKQPARNMGESLSAHPSKLFAAIKAGITPCSGAGFGCILIKRKVLEEMPFRVRWPEHGAHCDTPWSEDVYQKGYSQMADMSVICGHKTPEGEVLWPEM